MLQIYRVYLKTTTVDNQIEVCKLETKHCVESVNPLCTVSIKQSLLYQVLLQKQFSQCMKIRQ